MGCQDKRVSEILLSYCHLDSGQYLSQSQWIKCYLLDLIIVVPQSAYTGDGEGVSG
jgi:hypothetical protein